MLSTGAEWSAGLSAEHNPLRNNATVDLGHRGFAVEPVPDRLAGACQRRADVATRGPANHAATG
jgi:hypothetical protein